MMSMRRKQKGTPSGRVVAVPGGGHIVRSTGRKDRHSKVCTAKGLRDRRVRLSAHTAIDFYDVQDRLGYDRPSMAVDWLIKNAKAAIDQLHQLPPWQPPADPGPTATDSIDPFPSPNMFTFDLGSSAPSNAGVGIGIGIGECVSGFPDRHFLTQRESLQSSASPPSPFWIDSVAPASLLDALGGFSGFRVPSWTHGGSGEPSSSRRQ